MILILPVYGIYFVRRKINRERGIDSIEIDLPGEHEIRDIDFHFDDNVNDFE
jgi:hypothetical protein